MSKFTSDAEIHLTFNMRLTEKEARALVGLTAYGAHTFLETFYIHLGKEYVQPHSDGVRSLFSAVKEELPPILRRLDEARKAFG